MQFRQKKYLASVMLVLAFTAFVLVCCLIPDGKSIVKQVQKDVRLSVQEEKDSLEQFRIARRELRSLAKAQLNDVAHNGSSDTELKEMARRQLLDLCRREEQELNLENMLRLNGWKENIITIGQRAVNVFLRADSISESECSVILDFVCRETGITAGNVKIIPIN